MVKNMNKKIQMLLITALISLLIVSIFLVISVEARFYEALKFVKYCVVQTYIIRYHGDFEFNVSDLKLNMFIKPSNDAQLVDYLLYVNNILAKKIKEKSENGTVYIIAPSVKLGRNEEVNYTIVFYIAVVNAEERYPLKNMRTLNTSLLTKPTSLWNYSHPIIKKILEEHEFSNVEDIVYWFENLRRNGSLNYATHVPPLYPWEVIERGEGDCDEQANLFITLSRGVGIPSFLQYGAIYIEGYKYNETIDGVYRFTTENLGWHGWVIVYDNYSNAWIPVDLTFPVESKYLPVYAGGAVILNRTIVWGNIYFNDYIRDFNKLIDELYENNITIIEHDLAIKISEKIIQPHVYLSYFMKACILIEIFVIMCVICVLKFSM